MIKNYFVIIFTISFLLCSCATKTLWEKTDPNEYIKIKFTEITEEKLKKKGVKYITDEKNFVFLVEKNSFDKLKDYSVRIFGTPITIAIDASTLVIVGVAFAIVDNKIDEAREKGCREDPDCSVIGTGAKY